MATPDQLPIAVGRYAYSCRENITAFAVDLEVLLSHQSAQRMSVSDPGRKPPCAARVGRVTS